jgi:hypothetical protein
MALDPLRRVRTIRWDAVPELLIVEVETDGALAGIGESWGKAVAMEAVIHDFFIPVLRRLRP